MVATSLNQVWSPLIYKQLQDLSVKTVDANSSRFFVLQGLAIGVSGALLLVISPWVVDIGGARFMEFTNLEDELFLLTVAYALSIPWYHVQNYFFAFGKGRELMHLSLISSAIGIVVWIVAMWSLGPIGIYIGFLLYTAVRSAVSQMVAMRTWQVAIFWQGPILAVTLLIFGSFISRWSVM
jgi:hypothetical protein